MGVVSRLRALSVFIATCALLCFDTHSPILASAAPKKTHLDQKHRYQQQSHTLVRADDASLSARAGHRSSRSRAATSSRGRRGGSSTTNEIDSRSASSSSSDGDDRTAGAERRNANLTSSDSVEARLIQTGLGKCVYHLHGIPKSGTTWLEMIVKRLDEYWCNRTPGCTHEEVDIARNLFTKNSAVELIPGARHNAARLATVANSCGPKRLFTFMPKHLILPKIDMRGGNFLHTLKRDHACVLVDPNATSELYSRQMKACISSVAHSLNASLSAPCKTLAIIRDPRATAVSFCHYVRKPVESCHYLSPVEFSLSVLRLRFAYEYWHALVR